MIPMSFRPARSRLLSNLAAALAVLHLLGPCVIQCDDPAAGPIGALRALFAPASAPAAEPTTCCRHSPEPTAPAKSRDGGCTHGCPGRAQIVPTDSSSSVSKAVAAGRVAPELTTLPVAAVLSAVRSAEPGAPGGVFALPVPRAVPILLSASVLLV